MSDLDLIHASNQHIFSKHIEALSILTKQTKESEASNEQDQQDPKITKSNLNKRFKLLAQLDKAMYDLTQILLAQCVDDTQYVARLDFEMVMALRKLQGEVIGEEIVDGEGEGDDGEGDDDKDDEKEGKEDEEGKEAGDEDQEEQSHKPKPPPPHNEFTKEETVRNDEKTSGK